MVDQQVVDLVLLAMAGAGLAGWAGLIVSTARGGRAALLADPLRSARPFRFTLMSDAGWVIALVALTAYLMCMVVGGSVALGLNPAATTQPATTPPATQPASTQLATTQLATTQPASDMPESRTEVYTAAAAGSLIGQALFLPAAALLAFVLFAGRMHAWGLNRQHLTRAALLCIPAYVLIWPITLALAVVFQVVLGLIRPDYQPPTHEVLEMLTSPEAGPWPRVLLIASAVIGAPLAEELLFRGLLQPALELATARRWLSIVLAAGVFGVMHAGTPQYIPALVALGIWLSLLYLLTGSLWLPILTHAVFNAVTIMTQLALVPT